MQQNVDGVVKLFMQFGLFSILILVFSFSLEAKSFEDFKRTQSAEFTAYRDKNDKAFSVYLKAQWEEYTAQKSKPLYEKKKPKSINPTQEKKIISVGPRILIRIPKKPTQTSNIPVKKNTKYASKDKEYSVEFFGSDLGFNIDNTILKAKFYPVNQTGISNFFDILAMSNYGDTLRDIHQIVNKLELNDWGVYLLVNKIATQLYSNPDDARLFSWFMFNKLGYEVKIGLAKQHVVLMHYSQKEIYATPYYKFGKKKYYVVSQYSKKSKQNIYTYKQSYPKANKPLDLSLTHLPKLVNDKRVRKLSFKQYGKEYKSSFSYNQNLIDFMQTYPQADYDTYFNAPMSPDTYEALARDIKKYIDGKTSSVAINFVLNFVQKAFKYERDDKQFGREKVMFAEETLYYDKSDCEDRAILFAYLVKNLFGISVVGVRYKDHMATALYIPMKGDSVRVNRRKFIIADPTYINANIGQSMPKYRSQTPQSFIVLKGNEK